jgi:oligopeptide/dipeptide ABC transporter ATP-binding protein
VSALELHDIEVTYRRRGQPPVRAVAGVSLELERGQIIGLVGETGCGKSTVARAALGMVETSAGSVLFEGHEVKMLGLRRRARELVGLQMVFQNPYGSLNPRRRIGAQIADGLRSGANSAGRLRVEDILERVGLPASVSSRYPHEFSGGQRQRIAIARALAPQPSVIVLDEPLSSLDASAQAQIANLLVDLTQQLDVGLLLISHDLAIVRHVADAVAVMYLGEIVERAPTEELWAIPLHPYSEALTKAVPLADGSGVVPAGLRGEVPDPSRPPTGCRFHPRCQYQFDRCVGEVPPLVSLAPGRMAACWLQTDGDPAHPATKAAERMTLEQSA